MRELKFRAWDKVNNSWLTQNFFISSNGDNSSLTNYILMQYTGLKDKNGKEIYDGDILKRSYVESEFLNVVKPVETSEIIVVEWDKNYCGYKIPSNKPASPATMLLNPNGLPEFEVIGNIYENPELVKNKS